MRVFHGTSYESALALATETPLMRQREYSGKLPAFCVTTDIKTAEMFAIRRTPITAWPNITGKVVEFELAGQEGAHWRSVVDHRASLVDESEIAVYSADALRYIGTRTLDQ